MNLVALVQNRICFNAQTRIMNHEIVLTLTHLLLILFVVIDSLDFTNCKRQ